ncbi:MAG: type II and III secretion system protein family protein [Hyphomonas sp.]
MKLQLKTLASVVALGVVSAASPAIAEPNLIDTKIIHPGETGVSEHMTIGLNKSVVIELGSPAADIVIANPSIADAVVQTSQRIILRGVGHGETNALVFDKQGNQILDLQVSVAVDVVNLQRMIERHIPAARVNVEGVNGNVVLTGAVDSLAQSDQVERLVAASVGNGEEGGQIVNMLSVGANDQVMLEVRIVEMQRNMVKQLGVNLNGSPGFGDLASLTSAQLFADLPDDGINAIVDTGETTLVPGLPFSFQNTTELSNGFPIQGRSLGGITTNVGYTNYDGATLQSAIGASIDAMERVGIVRTLAEPNIVAISGESANFLAGGEFPVPSGQNEDGEISIEFKPYGVGLAFTPVVLAEDRISLKVSTEVSELTSQGQFQGESRSITLPDGTVQQVEGLTLPALTVRRAESVIELPSGGSMMMAGLIQSRSRQNLDQIPGLKKLPILGALFQSRDFLHEETELVVIVTPYLVDPARKDDLRTPADGYVNASDSKTVLFGKLNQQYGRDGAPVNADEYRAPVGFIEE